MMQVEIVDFPLARNAWIHRLEPVPDSVFRPALLACIERYTVTGVACLIGASIAEVLQWRQSRRNAKQSARRAVLLLESCSTKAIEALWDRLEASRTAVDCPVKPAKRTLPVVVSKDENKSPS